MPSRTKAYAGYLDDIYAQYDKLVASHRLMNGINLSVVEAHSVPDSDLENLPLEDLILLIFMQISEDARQDMRDILAEMEAAAQTKRRLRENIEKLKEEQEALEDAAHDHYGHPDKESGKRPIAQPNRAEPLDMLSIMQMLVVAAGNQSLQEAQSLADELAITRQHKRIDDRLDKAKDGRDSLSELGEMEALRLQLALDRLSKFEQALSNLLKKISETSEAIVENLK